MRRVVCTARGVPVYLPREPFAACAFLSPLSGPQPRKDIFISAPWQLGLNSQGLELRKERRQPLVCSKFSWNSLGGLFFQSPRESNADLVTPAITENVLQFSCVEHGQVIILKDSCGIQGVLFPFPFIFRTKKLGWKALPFWIPCHRNLTTILRPERITHKMTEIVSNTFFCNSWNSDTAVSRFFFECRQGWKCKGKTERSVYFQKNTDSAALAVSCSGQQAQALPCLCRKVNVGRTVRNENKKKAFAFL